MRMLRRLRSRSRRGLGGEKAALLHLPIERDRIQVKAVRPRQHTALDKHPGEHRRILQGLDHRSALREHIRKIADTLASIRKAQPQPIPIERLNLRYFDEFDHSTSAPATRSKGSRSLPRSQFASNSVRRRSIHGLTMRNAPGGNEPAITSPFSIAIRASNP